MKLLTPFFADESKKATVPHYVKDPFAFVLPL